MPRGPQGQYRPADVVGCAVMVGRIATGEIEEPTSIEDTPIGASGGRARAKRLTAKQRSDIARKAAQARWADRQKRDE